MDRQNHLGVAAGVALGAGVCALAALRGRTGGPHLSWEDAAPLACILAGLGLIAAAHRLHRLLFCPLELLRAPEDVGYITEGGRSKAQEANRVRRRRKTGDLPPVYPNGWYRVLDTHLVGRGEVKSVTVLGMLLLLLTLTWGGTE